MIEVFILSLIQGITEFLPVSSSSHLILISEYLEFENQSLSIDVSLHIGSFLAVIIYFRNDIKNRIVFEALKEEKCERCGFSERRVTDTQVPITISHKDGNTKNFHLDNIEFLCLNCSFLFGTVAEKSKVKVDITQKVDRTKENEEWEMDESHREHLKNLGLLDDENENPGEEYISRL